MKKNKFFIWCTVKRHLSKGSLKHTRIRYDYLFRWLGRKRLSVDTAEELILYLREKGLRNASINGYIRVLKLIDDYERENQKNLNLLKKIDYFPKQNRTPTILSFDEIEAIINADIPFNNYVRDGIATSGKYSTGRLEERHKFINETYRLSIWFLASTGCRIDEMASLTVENLMLGLNNDWVKFKDTKTMEDRDVPIPPRLAEELKEFIVNKKPNDLVFISSLGNKLVEQTFNRFLRKKVEIAGIKKHVYAHCFRNSYIMEHIRRGTGNLTISKLVGHRDANTTLGYTRFNTDDLIAGAENHPFFSRSLEPQKIMDKVCDIIDSLPSKTDPRFITKLTKTPCSVLVEIFVK